MPTASPPEILVSALLGAAGVMLVLSPFLLRLIASLKSGEFDD